MSEMKILAGLLSENEPLVTEDTVSANHMVLGTERAKQDGQFAHRPEDEAEGIQSLKSSYKNPELTHDDSTVMA